MKELTLRTYLEAHNTYNTGITGGTIHDFLKGSIVVYYGGKCPVYQIEHIHNGKPIFIGGRYAGNGKPKLEIFELLDF